MVEAAKYPDGVDGNFGCPDRRPGRRAKCGRAPLIDPLVRSRPVEVGPVLLEDAVKMILAEQEDVVQALPPQ